MTLLWKKGDQPRRKTPPVYVDERPVTVFDTDYTVIDESGNPLGPSFSVRFEASGGQWGADDEESDKVRSLDDLIGYLKSQAENRSQTIIEMLEDWEFRPYCEPTALRVSLKEEL